MTKQKFPEFMDLFSECMGLTCDLGVPTNATIAKHLSDKYGLSVETGTRYATALEKLGDAWLAADLELWERKS